MIFTILTPNYVTNSAGIACLWNLGNYLVDLGHEVYYINYQTPTLPQPEWSKMKEIKDWTTKGITIAPEVFPVIDMPHVRWCLNKPGLLGGPITYPAGTKVFHFSPEIEESARLAAADGVTNPFMLGTIQLPKLISWSKKFDTWYRGKYCGELPKECIEDHTLIEMTRTWPPTKTQYWNILMQTKNFYSFDDFTAVNIEAHLAGCKVFVWNGTGFEDYVVPKYADNLIIDYNRDLESVRKFVSCILEK